jgi:P-type Na+/K+ transporter
MAAETRKHPFLLQVVEVVEDLKTNLDKGLTSSQVTQLQQKYPPNELDIGSGIAWYTIFIRQLCNAMILVRLPIILFTMTRHLGVSDL